jgi:hypothetical protein
VVGLVLMLVLVWALALVALVGLVLMLVLVWALALVFFFAPKRNGSILLCGFRVYCTLQSCELQ